MRLIDFCALIVRSFSVSGAWAQGAAPNDAQIDHLVVTANQVDVDAGKLAKPKAKSPQVRVFGERMVVDHAAVIKAATELVERLHITAEPSTASERLQKGGDENLVKLKTLLGSPFDRAYVDRCCPGFSCARSRSRIFASVTRKYRR